MAKVDSIGIVEVQHFAKALEVLDLMCKSAAIKLLGHENYLGGRLVILTIGGKIDQVQAAIEAVSGRELPDVKSALCITNPHGEIMKYI
ncbi:MAG: BMC domain-containing protein [Turicibacter sp.]|nr:BMC domain-containing protein [Turicibacter sp.]